MLAPMWDWIVHQTLNNQFFAGGLVMGAIGWLAMYARSWPVAIGAFLARQTMTEIQIRSTDGNAFMHVALWLGKHKSRKGARRLGMVDYWDNDEDDCFYEVTFGFGNHVLWDGLFPIFINRHVNDADSNTGRPVQTLTLKMFGRSHKRVLDILARAKKDASESTKVNICLWRSGSYVIVDRKEPRSMDSIIMPEADKEKIANDLRSFLDGKSWYRDRGLPWRRGYLLEGPPGTGKSSAIFALAGVAKKSVYIINPSTVMNDNELMEAFAAANDGIIVLEDIDAVDISNARETEKTEDKPENRKITLSGLLNAIDGVAARDGRVLFITSNHPDKLDGALIRPGRVDRRLHMGLLDRELGRVMWDRFYPGEDGTVFLDRIQWPVSPAYLQGELLNWKGSTVIELDTKAQIIHKERVGGAIPDQGDVEKSVT